MKRIEIFAHREVVVGDIISIRIALRTTLSGKDSISIAEPLVFKTLEDDGMITQPAFSLTGDDAQRFMDELWREGVRPSDVGTAGHLAAVKYHLEDMRRLVFEREK